MIDGLYSIEIAPYTLGIALSIVSASILLVSAMALPGCNWFLGVIWQGQLNYHFINVHDWQQKMTYTEL